MNKLKVWLPSSDHINQMNNEYFKEWVREAKNQLPRRVELRDPIIKLKERISQIIESDASEEEKEKEVICAIERYETLLLIANEESNKV